MDHAGERAEGATRRVLWIGGAQWVGKTSVAQLLAVRHPLIHYAYDYHDARDHAARARAEPERYPRLAGWLAAHDRDPDAVWVRPTPETMAASALANFADRFLMVLENLRALPAGATVVAEGWGLRPDLIAPLLESPDEAAFLVPTEAYVAHQVRVVPRAMGFNPAFPVSDPERAQRNRLARNRLLAQDVVESAARYGLRVIMVDGSQGVDGLTEMVEAQFRPYLPGWLY